MSSILEKLVENRKMPVLFIGSGISKRYLYKFPDWETLLKTSFYKVNQDPYFYQQHKDELLRKNLTDFEINKALGTIIENEFNRAFFQRKIKIKNPNLTGFQLVFLLTKCTFPSNLKTCNYIIPLGQRKN